MSWHELNLKVLKDLASGGKHESAEMLLAAVIHNSAEAICLRLDNLTSMLREKGVELMTQLDDLNAAVSSMTTAVANAAAELSKLAAEVKTLSSAATIDPAAVEAAAQKIQAQADALTAATTGAEPPAPAPTA